jgi:diadenylate cyclase
VTEILRSSTDTLHRLDLRALLDITLIAAVIYWLLLWLRGTSAMSLLRGVAIVAAVCLALGNLFDLTVVNWLLRNSLTALLVAIPIIFQPELRRALERVGRAGMRTWRSRAPQEGLPTAVTESARQCSELRHGALVVLEGETGLQDYVATGVPLDAVPSAALLVAIFYANSPLHDGAVIVREGRIAAAHCTLPLAEAADGMHLGTRHRAALGISERTDAIAVVVSEETGEISLASNGRLLRPLDPARLLGFLEGESGSVALTQPVADSPEPRVAEAAIPEGAVLHQ